MSLRGENYEKKGADERGETAKKKKKGKTAGK
jgi:hypothetical protein